MTELYNISKLFGKWSIIVNTPFGEENYTLNIDTIGSLKSNSGYDFIVGSIHHEKGNVKFDNGIIQDNVFYCSVETEFPIKTTISITINLINSNKISGNLNIDKYLTTSFIGVR